MESAPQNYDNYQEKSFALISQARDQCRNSKQKIEKEKAFEDFKRGIEMLSSHYTFLKNDDTKPYIKVTISNLIEEAEKMKAEMNKMFNGNELSEKLTKEDKSSFDKSDSDVSKEKDAKYVKIRAIFEGKLMENEPTVEWKEIVGLQEVKQALAECLIIPTKFPQFFTGTRRPYKGLLLYGPPSGGKKLLMKAVSKEAGLSFFGVSSMEFTSRSYGNHKAGLKSLFEVARENKPAVVFIDEIEKFSSHHQDSESEIEFVNPDNDGIYIVLVTNFPWDIDRAILKRLEKRLYFHLPHCQEREELIRVMLKANNTLGDKEFKELSERTEGFSRADISFLVQAASLEIIRKLEKASFCKQVGTNSNGEPIYTPCDPDVEGSVKIKLEELKPEQIQSSPISMEEFLTVLKNIKPTVTPDEIKKYEQFKRDFGPD